LAQTLEEEEGAHVARATGGNTRRAPGLAVSNDRMMRIEAVARPLSLDER
jgi:hypothetical protein